VPSANGAPEAVHFSSAALRNRVTIQRNPDAFLHASPDVAAGQAHSGRSNTLLDWQPRPRGCRVSLTEPGHAVSARLRRTMPLLLCQPPNDFLLAIHHALAEPKTSRPDSTMPPVTHRRGRCTCDQGDFGRREQCLGRVHVPAPRRRADASCAGRHQGQAHIHVPDCHQTLGRYQIVILFLIVWCRMWRDAHPSAISSTVIEDA